ncbi:MAG: hypothetical protein K0S07_1567 [Chlamydiales bacterium]|nr:hypothetical protein [Chlamydiales bacterium]
MTAFPASFQDLQTNWVNPFLAQVQGAATKVDQKCIDISNAVDGWMEGTLKTNRNTLTHRIIKMAPLAVLGGVVLPSVAPAYVSLALGVGLMTVLFFNKEATKRYKETSALTGSILAIWAAKLATGFVHVPNAKLGVMTIGFAVIAYKLFSLAKEPKVG